MKSIAITIFVLLYVTFTASAQRGYTYLRSKNDSTQVIKVSLDMSLRIDFTYNTEFKKNDYDGFEIPYAQFEQVNDSILPV